MVERPDQLAESDRIKLDIDRTREQMTGTIDEIQERLHPARLLQDATSSFREASVDSVKRAFGHAGRTAERTAGQAKEASAAAAGYARTHPIPTAMLLAGLALVVARWAGGPRATPRVDDWDDVPNGDGARRAMASGTSWIGRNSLAVGAAVVAAGTVAGIRWANGSAQPPDTVKR